MIKLLDTNTTDGSTVEKYTYGENNPAARNSTEISVNNLFISLVLMFY